VWYVLVVVAQRLLPTSAVLYLYIQQVAAAAAHCIT
jgi:hypothetical protein